MERRTHEGGPRTGVVVIGRNEGARLERALGAACVTGHPVVYVDSGSTDGSVDTARRAGVAVVVLDTSKPFTAARGRNAGLDHLSRTCAELEYVQFVDGDCVLAPGWIAEAEGILDARPDVAAVAGRLREEHPEASPYNRLAEMEWAVSQGEVDACGGIAMMRLRAVCESGLFNSALMAWEELELCFRMVRRGWKILRVGTVMAWHDAAILRFGQWWKRGVRGGVGLAQSAPYVMGTRIIRRGVSAVAWGLVLPALVLGLAWPTRGASLLGFLLYGVVVLRVAQDRRRRGDGGRNALLCGVFSPLLKLATVEGLVRYLVARVLLRRPASVVDYKASAPR